MDAEWRGYTSAALSLHGLTRGAPVLKWAAERLRADKALVAYLVWANPTNLSFASPALQADADVVAAALASPFYAEQPPPVPPSCVLRSAAEELRASREVVLAALARSGYEFEFASEVLRADAHLVAWAGAPVGSFGSRELSKTFVRMLKSGCSVEYIDANCESIMKDDCCAATRLGDGGLSGLLAEWPTLPLRTPLGMFHNHSCRDKHAACALLKRTLDVRCPLCLRVAPPVREVLWPDGVGWDGVF